MTKNEYHKLLYYYIRYAEETARLPNIDPRFLELAEFIKKSLKANIGFKHTADEIEAIKSLRDYLITLTGTANRRPPPIDFSVHYTDKNFKVWVRRTTASN